MDELFKLALQITPGQPAPTVEFFIKLLLQVEEIERAGGIAKWCQICEKPHRFVDGDDSRDEYRGYAD